MDEMIEKRLASQGVDVQTDEGAQRLQDEIERHIARKSKVVQSLPLKLSDIKRVERVRGIRI